MTESNFERLDIFKLAETLADCTWTIVCSWEHFARDTVGKQFVRAADSIGANIAEGSGCSSTRDNQRYIRIARGSLYETKYWLRRACSRGLISNDQSANLFKLVNELSPRLNAYLNFLRKRAASKKRRHS